jgi:hypothetical protein
MMRCMPSAERSRSDVVLINRAPVLTLWSAVVAQRLGFDWDVAVTLGRAVAGLYAASKARTLGLTKPRETPKPKKPGERQLGRRVEIQLLGRTFAAVETEDGLRAIVGEKPASPESVHRYLRDKFGEHLEEVRSAMTTLARSRRPQRLADEAWALYESFRPTIPRAAGGWGAKGVLDLDRIRALAGEAQ